jgi:signal transduction histidine kinase
MPNIHIRKQPALILRLIIYLGLNSATVLLAAVFVEFVTDSTPFLIFLPTIAFCTWFGGFIIGAVTTLISMVSVILMLFYPLGHPLLSTDIALFIKMCIFFFVGLFISFLIHTARQQDKITDYQKRLRQSHHIIETLEKNFDSAQMEIKARDQFLAIASHELKTPVTSMLLQVQTAIHNIRNVSLANFSVATLLKMLEDTETQSKRLSKMVNDLLDLSLITTGKIDLEIEKTNISDIVNAVAQRNIPRLSDKNQLVVLANEPVNCFCDKLRIEQAIINLVSNAIKYGNNKPITITATSNGNRVKIIVKDQGIGIPAEQQKKIYNLFERAVSSRNYQGLGVGLYITYQIVKAHKGKIQLQSQPDKGSTFTVELPLTYIKK